MAPPALKTTLLVAPPLIAALMVIDESAWSVRDCAAAQVTGSETRMVPVPAPALVVLTIMSAVPSAVERVVLLRFEVAASVPSSAKVSATLVKLAVVAAELIVTSVGSSSSVPVRPFGALRSVNPL